MGELCTVMTLFSGLSCLGALSRSFLIGPYVGRHRTSAVQVNKITRIVYVVFLLIMLTGSCFAVPRIEQTEEGSAVYFKSRFCQPITESDLRRRMGDSFDGSHMAHGGEDTIKRSASDSDGEDTNDEEEEDDDDMSEYFETADGEVGESDILDYAEGDTGDKDTNPFQSDSTTHTPIYNFMRKKRDLNNDLDDNTLQLLLNSKDKKMAGDVDLHLQLLLSGKNKKARKQLKKKIRAKARKSLFKKPPPWECKMDSKWQRMKAGFFPTYVQTGRCRTNKCFYRLYDCIPKKYAIKLLKRDPDQCNPLPTIGLNATYEERWFFVRHYVTVGCDCSKRQKSRRRGRY